MPFAPACPACALIHAAKFPARSIDAPCGAACLAADGPRLPSEHAAGHAWHCAGGAAVWSLGRPVAHEGAPRNGAGLRAASADERPPEIGEIGQGELGRGR